MSEETEKEVVQREDNAVNLRDLYYMCVSKWYWFVISLAICLTIAVFNILRTPPVYTRTASILIKEMSKSRSNMNVAESFQSFNLFTNSVNIKNEMATFNSTNLMEEVVKRLDLEMSYMAPGRFHKITLYGPSLPVIVELPDLDNQQSASFTMKLQPKGKFVLSDFHLDGEEFEDKTVNGTLSQEINSPIGKIIVKPNKDYSPDDEGEIFVSKSTLRGAVERYLSELTVSQDDEESSIIRLTVNDVSTRRADDILNMLITVYNENWVKDKNQIAVSTSMFINDRLGIIENELGNVDSDISSYKSEHLIPDLAGAAQMYMNQANQAQNTIQQLNSQVYMARYLRNYLANEANKNQVLPVTSGIDNSGDLSRQINDYNNKVLERNNLVSYSSESNPLVIEMDKGLAELRGSMLASIDNQIVALNTQIRGYQGTAGRATSQIASNPNQAKYLLSVERQQKVKESLYLYLLQKREENELSQAFTAYNTRMIEDASGNNIPTAPRKGRILMIAFIIGLIIPLAIIYIREMLNTVVRGRKDIESLTIPFVGEIPNAKTDKSKKGGKLGIGHDAIVIKEGSRNIINEAFRVVRTNLEFMLGPGHHVIAITSANPGSGKTFITFNLADVIAIKKKKVVVIDLDLRMGTLSKFAEKRSVGIADYLAGKCNNINDIIVKDVEGTSVDLIPVGTLPPNPTELLFSPLLSELIEKLREEYDFIFLDCPPVEIVADAAIINTLADKTLFIIRAGVFERSMLADVEKFYTSGKYKNLNIILNGTDGGGSHYGYRYGYRYGYKYGYSYGKKSYYTHDD